MALNKDDLTQYFEQATNVQTHGDKLFQSLDQIATIFDSLKKSLDKNIETNLTPGEIKFAAAITLVLQAKLNLFYCEGRSTVDKQLATSLNGLTKEADRLAKITPDENINYLTAKTWIEKRAELTSSTLAAEGLELIQHLKGADKSKITDADREEHKTTANEKDSCTIL